MRRPHFPVGRFSGFLTVSGLVAVVAQYWNFDVFRVQEFVSVVVYDFAIVAIWSILSGVALLYFLFFSVEPERWRVRTMLFVGAVVTPPAVSRFLFSAAWAGLTEVTGILLAAGSTILLCWLDMIACVLPWRSAEMERGRPGSGPT